MRSRAHLPTARGTSRHGRRGTRGAAHRCRLSARPLARLAIHTLPGGRGLALSGELDGTGRAAVARAIDALLGRPGGMMLDLAGLRFMDSAGIHVLIRAAEGLSRDEAITVRNAHPSVQRLLMIAGIRMPRGRLRIEPLRDAS